MASPEVLTAEHVERPLRIAERAPAPRPHLQAVRAWNSLMKRATSQRLFYAMGGCTDQRKVNSVSHAGFAGAAPYRRAWPRQANARCGLLLPAAGGLEIAPGENRRCAAAAEILAEVLHGLGAPPERRMRPGERESEGSWATFRTSVMIADGRRCGRLRKLPHNLSNTDYHVWSADAESPEAPPRRSSAKASRCFEGKLANTRQARRCHGTRAPQLIPARRPTATPLSTAYMHLATASSSLADASALAVTVRRRPPDGKASWPAPRSTTASGNLIGLALTRPRS